MTAENIALFESVMPLYNRMISMCGWEALSRTGILGQIEVAFNPDPENPTSLKQIMRQEFNPAFDYDGDDFGAVYQAVLHAFTRYQQYVASL